MKVCILAVSPAGDNYSIAGISTDGEWVRPISDGPTAPYWDDVHLSFDLGFGFIRVGDIIEFDAQKPVNQENHSPEDYIVHAGDMILKQRLSNDQLLWFLEEAVESQEDFKNTVQGNGRSLCVMRVDRMKHYLSEQPGELAVPKMALTNVDFHLINPEINSSNFTVKDSKWGTLIRNNKVNNRVHYHHIYVVIGMELSENGTGTVSPQIIGMCTDPEIDLPVFYPD